MAEVTLSQAYQQAVAANYLYNRNRDRWQFLLDSYQGGDSYRTGSYLQRYQLESDKDYELRLRNTPLDNQVKSLISLYISFLFRQEPEREFGSLANNFIVADMLEDADLDGRSMAAFMKDVAIWAGVFGHVWVCVAQPNVGAVTLADQQQQGARPYLGVYTPLVVTDWTWTQQPNGAYILTYIKLVEEINDTFSLIKEWTPDTITSTTINVTKKVATDIVIEPNELGRLPFVCVYAERSPVRGLGTSLVEDIADQQRMIYNELSEVYDSIRLDTHPSLVATADTNIGTGAGALIHMPENLDPALKPYVLQFQGAAISSIYDSINNRKKMIDSMGNVGSVRATSTSSMSGIAIETEFQLLNARLSSIADNLELGEELIWQEVAQYLNTTWDGVIDYPDNFALRNVDNELARLTTAIDKITDPVKRVLLEDAILESLDIEVAEQAVSTSSEGEHPSLADSTPEQRQAHIQGMIMEGYADNEILALHPEISQADITAAKTALLDL
jgi:hypothetical protein